MADSAGLTVAVTGPTGTFGFGLTPHLEADPRVAQVVGIARRPFAATTRAINVDGTVAAFRAAADAGARRFVHASSVAAYGFHRDNPVPMTEAWPVRPGTTEPRTGP